MPPYGRRVSSRSLALVVLACAMLGRTFDAAPHPDAARSLEAGCALFAVDQGT
jgi:hypothetical protein